MSASPRAYWVDLALALFVVLPVTGAFVAYASYVALSADDISLNDEPGVGRLMKLSAFSQVVWVLLAVVVLS